MNSEFLNNFRKYLDSTPKQELIEQWSKIEELGLQGPNAFEYIDFLSEYHIRRSDCSPEQLLIPENMTPDFSGSFFLCVTSHYERRKESFICL